MTVAGDVRDSLLRSVPQRPARRSQHVESYRSFYSEICAAWVAAANDGVSWLPWSRHRCVNGQK